MQMLGPAVTELFPLRTPGVLPPLAAEVVTPAVRSAGPHQLRQRLGERLVALLAFAQALLHRLDGRDIATDTDQPDDLTLAIAQRYFGRQDPVLVPLRVRGGFLARKHGLSGERLQVIGVVGLRPAEPVKVEQLA